MFTRFDTGLRALIHGSRGLAGTPESPENRGVAAFLRGALQLALTSSMYFLRREIPLEWFPAVAMTRPDRSSVGLPEMGRVVHGDG